MDKVLILGKTITTGENKWKLGTINGYDYDGTDGNDMPKGVINIGWWDNPEYDLNGNEIQAGTWRRIFNDGCTETTDSDYPGAKVFECTTYFWLDDVYITKEGTSFHKVLHHNPSIFDDVYNDMLVSGELYYDTNIQHTFTNAILEISCSATN